VQGGAHREGSVRVHGAFVRFHELDNALLVDDDVGAHSPLISFIVHVVAFEDAITSEHLPVHVAEEREGDADLLGEGGIGGGTIQTNSENFGIRGVNLTGGDSSLDRLKLFRSTTSESQDVDGEKDVLLAAVIAELHGFPLVAEQSEVGSGVADLEGHFGDFRLPGLWGSGSGGEGDSGQKSQSNRAFHQNLPSETGYLCQQQLTPCHLCNTTGTAKIFPDLWQKGDKRNFRGPNRVSLAIREVL
jgi:hypothetical protein